MATMAAMSSIEMLKWKCATAAMTALNLSLIVPCLAWRQSSSPPCAAANRYYWQGTELTAEVLPLPKAASAAPLNPTAPAPDPTEAGSMIAPTSAAGGRVPRWFVDSGVGPRHVHQDAAMLPLSSSLIAADTRAGCRPRRAPSSCCTQPW